MGFRILVRALTVWLSSSIIRCTVTNFLFRSTTRSRLCSLRRLMVLRGSTEGEGEGEGEDGCGGDEEDCLWDGRWEDEEEEE